METLKLSISVPGLVPLLGDMPTMQRWEMLRRAQRPFTPAQLAEAGNCSLKNAQDSLDRLLAIAW
jgi:hypothetical protein